MEPFLTVQGNEREQTSILQFTQKTNLASAKLTECISYFKRAERVQAAFLGDPLVVVEETGYVLWWQGDPTVVEQQCRYQAVCVLSLLSGDHS